MKKFLIAATIATLAITTVAAAASFDVNLTVGSTGSDVVALQTALINSGYSIAAISSGAASKGYFGSQTKAAVMKYQANNGIPATGFVGPLTRAS
jgi:peptidoglycan hydrolase-like protein with peptidoglycan-binding domain